MRASKVLLRFHCWLKLGIGFLVCALASGCLSNKAFWLKIMNKSPGTFTVAGEYQKEGLRPPLVLNTEQITNAVVGTETNGTICVSYGKDLQSEAALVARTVDQTLTQTEKELGATLPLRPHIYLLRIPSERRVIQFSMSVPETHRSMPWLMILTNPPPQSAAFGPGPEALWAELPELPSQIFLIAHESFEMHLIDPAELLVMGDVSGGNSFLHVNLKYHTRWFRDGLANYTAVKASQCFRRQVAEAGVKPGTLQFMDNSMQPFSELAKVKDKLFDWNQNSTNDYYAAATGLFLLIEQRKGPEAITAVIHELPKVKFPDGKALLKMLRRQTGLDLRELARSFLFPNLGFEMRTDAQGRPEVEKVAPDSWAARAGLLKGDVLLEANDCLVAGPADIELQILKALDKNQRLSFAFCRNGERHQTEALPLPADKPR